MVISSLFLGLESILACHPLTDGWRRAIIVAASKVAPAVRSPRSRPSRPSVVCPSAPGVNTRGAEETKATRHCCRAACSASSVAVSSWQFASQQQQQPSSDAAPLSFPHKQPPCPSARRPPPPRASVGCLRPPAPAVAGRAPRIWAGGRAGVVLGLRRRCHCACTCRAYAVWNPISPPFPRLSLRLLCNLVCWLVFLKRGVD